MRAKADQNRPAQGRVAPQEARGKSEVLSKLQLATATSRTPPVVSHVQGGQKAAPVPQPPAILSDVHERTGAPSRAPERTSMVPAAACTEGKQHAPVTCTGTGVRHGSKLASLPQQAASNAEGVQNEVPSAAEVDAGPCSSGASASKPPRGAVRHKKGQAAFCSALLRDVQRSVQAQGMEAPIEPGDFFEEQSDSSDAETAADAACGLGSEATCRPGTGASLASHHCEHGTAAAHSTAGGGGPVGPQGAAAAAETAGVSGNMSEAVIYSGSASAAAAGVQADVERYTGPHAGANPRPRTTVKNKFKPVRGCPQSSPGKNVVSSADLSCSEGPIFVPEDSSGTNLDPSATDEIPQNGGAAAGGRQHPYAQHTVSQAAGEAVSPPKTPSEGTVSPACSQHSLPAPLSNGAKKRVLFGTCQMFAYDPEAPPADGGDGGICEVPLPPASPPPAQAPIVPSALCCAAGSAPSHSGTRTAATADERLLPLQTGPARHHTSGGAAGAGPEAEATPVLYFDVKQGAGENEMEGALRVTTAEALNLSETDLDTLQQRLEDRQPLSEADEGVAEAPTSSGGEGGTEGQASQRRRPRLRGRRSSGATPMHSELAPETQHDLRRQAVADMFRYYLAPEAGGLGVAVQAEQLHDVAASLKDRRGSAHRNVSAPGEGVAESGPAHGGVDACVGAAGVQVAPHEQVGATHSSDEEASQCSAHEEDLWDVDVDSDACGSSSESEACHDDEQEAEEDSSAGRAPEETVHGEEGEEQPQSVEGFFDSRAVSKPRLSLFGVAWSLLSSWVCPATVLHLHARPPPSAAFPHSTIQAQSALRRMLMPRAAAVMQQLHVEVARPVVEGALYDVISTLDIRAAVPSMAPALQDCIVLVLLAALSKYCVERLADAFGRGSTLLAGLLHDIGISMELFSCLLGCLLDPESDR